MGIEGQKFSKVLLPFSAILPLIGSIDGPRRSRSGLDNSYVRYHGRRSIFQILDECENDARVEVDRATESLVAVRTDLRSLDGARKIN